VSTFLRRSAYVALVVVGLSLLPPVQSRAKAMWLVADALGLPLPHPFAPSIARTEVALGGVTGDRYDPGGTAPGVLLIHGAAKLGKDDPRLVRLATAIARTGRVVFVPALELAERRFAAEDIERIVLSAEALAADPSVEGTPTVLGISYGGSFALIAAADPRFAGSVSLVAVFGAYFDLIGVVQAVTTGSSIVAGERLEWHGDPMAGEVLEKVALELASPRVRKRLRAALDGRLPASELSKGALALHDLLQNRDPERTYAIAERLTPSARALFDRFSPSSVAAEIRVPVVAMHSTADPAVPYAESGRLVRGLPGTRLVTVGSFRHVDFETPSGWGAAAGDLFGAWKFATWLLSPGE
jgi:pimeloyl-ACP methyl ester carboxylesterase